MTFVYNLETLPCSERLIVYAELCQTETIPRYEFKWNWYETSEFVSTGR